jgi:hypothetical protein
MIIGFYSFRTLSNKYADVLASLGIPPAMAKNLVSNSFIGAYFSQPGNPAYKSYPAGKRAEAVKQIGVFVKNYIMSAEFQKRYMENYEFQKPKVPQTIEQRVQEQLEDYRKMIRQNEESIKKMDKQYKPVFENNIKGLNDYIKIYEDENHPKHARQMQGVKLGYEADVKSYTDRLAELDKKFPKDIKQFVRIRLEEFLQLSATVDFDAELIQDGKLKRFVKPEYEGKGMSWKHCFRAGKETVEAARAFAQQWLKEL